MAKFIGSRTRIGIGKETTRGVGVSPEFLIPALQANFDNELVVKSYGEHYMNLAGYGSLGYLVKKGAKSRIVGEIDVDSFGLFLLTAFGTVSSSVVADSAYTHTFTLDETNKHDSLTLTEISPITDSKYCLAMLRKLEIIVEPDNVVTFDVEFLSQNAVAVS